MDFSIAATPTNQDENYANPITHPHDGMDFERRFGGLSRLYGPEALERLKRARVCVVGVGGVGSWTVEALARSAVGHITMIDLDHVAESNINRQVHAGDRTLGQAKVIALSERILDINPLCDVNAIEDFIDEDNLEAFIGAGKFDYVVDAVDSVAAKVSLISFCRARAIPLVTIGAAGGQMDPTRGRVTDLARTEQEPLLAKVRKRLRVHHGFPRDPKTRLGIDAVFSDEPLIYPSTLLNVAQRELAADDSGDKNAVTGLNCAGFGSVVAVTAVFGLVAAGHVLRHLVTPQTRPTSLQPVQAA